MNEFTVQDPGCDARVRLNFASQQTMTTPRQGEAG
jgi:hypothetical protein